MNKYLYLAILNEDTKKFITALLIVLLLVLVLIGIVTSSIQKWSKKKAQEVDLYLYDMCKYQILENPKDLKRYGIKREIKEFYFKNRIIIRIFALITIAYALIMKFKYNNDYAQALSILKDILFKLESPKAEFFGFKNFPVDWPVITKKSVVHLSLIGYSTYIEAITIIFLFVETFKNTIVLKEKIKRIKEKAIRYFAPGIDEEK